MAFWNPFGWSDKERESIRSVVQPLMQVASMATTFSGGGGAAKAGGAGDAAGTAGTAGGTAGGTASTGADLKIDKVRKGATGHDIVGKGISAKDVPTNNWNPGNVEDMFSARSGPEIAMGTGLSGGSPGSLGFSKLPDIPAINDPLGRITTDQLGGTSIKKVQPKLGSTNLPGGQLPQTKGEGGKLTPEIMQKEFNQGKVEGGTPKTQPKTQPKPKKDFWDFLKTEKGKKLLEKTSEMGRKLTRLAAGSGAPNRLSESTKNKIKKKARKKYRGRT